MQVWMLCIEVDLDRSLAMIYQGSYIGDIMAAQVLGLSTIGENTMLASDVIIGHPSKASMLAKRDFSESNGAIVGMRCIIRSGTVVYEDTVIGNGVQTAHHVVIRESVTIGDDCVLGNGSVVREGAVLGRNVRIMESVVVCEGARIADDVFIGPHVIFTAGRHMTGAMEAAGRMTHT